MGFDAGNVCQIDCAPTWGVTASGFTCLCWVRIRSVGGYSLVIGANAGGANVYVLWISNTEGNAVRFDSTPDGSFYAGNTALGTTTLVAERWYRVGATYAPDGNRVFVQGRQEAFKARTNEGIDVVTQELLGRGAGTVRGLNGYLDGVAIYRRALSAPEMMAEYLEAARGYPGLLRRPAPPWLVGAAAGAASRFFFGA